MTKRVKSVKKKTVRKNSKGKSKGVKVKAAKKPKGMYTKINKQHKKEKDKKVDSKKKRRKKTHDDILTKEEYLKAAEAVDKCTEVVMLPLHEVKPLKDNPKELNNQVNAAKKLSQIIKVFGQVSSIVVWKKDMQIYKGNITYRAMEMLGKKKIKVMLVDFPNEQVARAYAIADENSKTFSKLDISALPKFISFKEYDPVTANKETKKLLALSMGFSVKNFEKIFHDKPLTGTNFVKEDDSFDKDKKNTDEGLSERLQEEYLMFIFNNKKQREIFLELMKYEGPKRQPKPISIMELLNALSKTGAKNFRKSYRIQCKRGKVPIE